MVYENKKILLTGGGTGGSVSPLLAIAEELKKTYRHCEELAASDEAISVSATAEIATLRRGGFARNDIRFSFLFLGTKNGPEKEMVASAAQSTGDQEGIKFKAIFSGKLRRYFSFKNLSDLFLIIAGLFQSFFIILKWKPDLIISAGSFVSVPIIWAGWILRVPILIHQQDVRPGLANKLMAPFAKIITVTFEESLKDYGKKAVWTGNPSRSMEHITHNIFNFKNDLPVVLVIGGGTGAMAINELIWKSLNELIKFCQIIHIAGKNKIHYSEFIIQNSNYQSFEFLNANQIAGAYAASDIVVSRAGLGVLTELSNLGKPAILIPIPNSHQEDNAEIFGQAEAAIILNQKKLTSDILVGNIKKLLEDKFLKSKLSENIKRVIKTGANELIAEIIIKNLQ